MIYLLSQFGISYNTYLETYPLLTKATTTAVIGLIGDAAAQFHEERLRIGRNKDKGSSNSSSSSSSSSCSNNILFHWYDTRRGLANVLNNLMLTTPIYHYGYNILESVLPVYNSNG